jgi:hypothetical protein
MGVLGERLLAAIWWWRVSVGQSLTFSVLPGGIWWELRVVDRWKANS